MHHATGSVLGCRRGKIRNDLVGPAPLKGRRPMLRALVSETGVKQSRQRSRTWQRSAGNRLSVWRYLRRLWFGFERGRNGLVHILCVRATEYSRYMTIVLDFCKVPFALSYP